MTTIMMIILTIYECVSVSASECEFECSLRFGSFNFSFLVNFLDFLANIF